MLKGQTCFVPKGDTPMSDFTFGINLPWFNGQYDHDLGPNPHHPDWAIWYDGETVSKAFQEIKDIGFQAVRI